VADDGHGGKVPGKWKDSLPIIPDRAAELLDAGRDVPLEALVSDKALEGFAAHVAKQAEPVHAEDLIPVSRNDPRIAGPSFGNGSTLPNVPKMRRVIPAPFQRPSIHIDHHGKTWQRKLVTALKAGDIVPDVGRLAFDPFRVVRYRKRSELTASLMPPAWQKELSADSDVQAGDVDVAVGVEYLLRGIDGKTRCYREGDQVRVFTDAPQEAAGVPAGV
jgi:hypothetical protein